MNMTQYGRRQQNNSRYTPASNSPQSYAGEELAVLRREMGRSRSKQEEAAVTLGRIEDRLNDLIRDMETKVDKNVYTGELARLGDRLLRLESGPQKFMQWAAVAVSALALLITILGMAGAAIVFIVTHGG